MIDTLIFDENHPNNFPLFVRMRAEGLADGDVTIISHRFSYLVYTVLHAIITKNVFDSETEKRSKEFEKKKVKEEFEKQGFIYKPNIVDKRKASLEIDGIAVKRERCYVVECKGWRLPHLIDEPDKRSQVLRDVKGIIKGEKYSFKNSMLITTKKPNLPEKIEFVKENLYDLIGNIGPIKAIEGLIVLSDYPGISEMDGIQIKPIDDIASL